MKRLAAALLVATATAAALGPAWAQAAAPDSTAAKGAPASAVVDSTAQPPALLAPADTSATRAPADTTAPTPPSRARARAARAAVGMDAARFELGAAIVDGPFDVLGTFAYHRYVRRGGPFEQWIHLEVSGGATKYLNEGAVSAAYLLRPIRAIRRGWPIRPILEVGPAAHLVVQVAEVQGFSSTAFHARSYLKTHAYGGFEALLTRQWGLVARGRFSVPAHRPFDYAQIALFLR